ncbi:MAG TPA: DUF2769 domain-containing protein [Candidatus Bathyarchaeia archaeon]|nr:DUF2769 domain-containing protein [Candidatus Bathyarchaeia archaeon]
MIEDENVFKNASFEEKIKLMDKMTEKEKNDGIEQIKFMCRDNCGKCPSYKGSGETNFGFCSTGRSSLIKENKGCLCNQCPIYKMMGFRWVNYCIKGSALELSNIEK